MVGHEARVAGQPQDAAAGHRVAVDRRHDGPGEGEDLEHHPIELPDEGVQRGPVQLVEGNQVEAGREKPVIAGEDHSPRAPLPCLIQGPGDGDEALGIQGVGLAAGEADLSHAVAPFDRVESHRGYSKGQRPVCPASFGRHRSCTPR